MSLQLVSQRIFKNFTTVQNFCYFEVQYYCRAAVLFAKKVSFLFLLSFCVFCEKNSFAVSCLKFYVF